MKNKDSFLVENVIFRSSRILSLQYKLKLSEDTKGCKLAIVEDLGCFMKLNVKD